MSTPSWEKKPVLFLLLATLTILAGTIVTMVLPFAWVNTDEDRIDAVKPYTPLQLAGRDVYIREGCNNCHTQTVRPLVAEVKRYGDYSRSGEFVYDRPHLWGSRRTGPDLARVGGKYPDAWHYQHMAAPTSIVPRSNMPAYTFLAGKSLNAAGIRHSMQVLGFPFAEQEIAALAGKTEMDAMVAYMQKLGSDIPWRQAARQAGAAETLNPFAGDAVAVAAGAGLYGENCAGCHGAGREGGIGPALSPGSQSDADLFATISNGIEDGGMPAFANMGREKVWQIVTFLQAQKK